MKKLILVYGGNNLTPNESAFVEDLCYYLLHTEDIVLVTGGFISKAGAEQGDSTDTCVLRGTLKYAKDSNKKLNELIEVWLPDPDKDRKEEGVKRFPKETGDIFKLLEQNSSQARRLKMVSDVDLIITISGRKHTEMVLDAAKANNKLAFPLPITEGDSRDFWFSNKTLIKKSFDISDDFADELEKVNIEEISESKKNNLIKKIGIAIQKKINRRCLVLMDFDTKLDNYYTTIKDVVEKTGFKPIRIDQEANEGNILKTFQQRLKDCDAIIADITDHNPNVMYELGQAHALNYSTILICRKKLDSRSWEELPFYLTMDTIENGDVTNNEGLIHLSKCIEKQLNKKRGL